MKRKKEKVTTSDSVVARDRRARGEVTIEPATEVAITNKPVAPGSTATTGTEPAPLRKRTRSEAALDYRRDVREGKRIRIEKPHVPPPDPDRNPLFDLPEKKRAKLFVWLRECPYLDAVRVMLRRIGVTDVTDKQLDQFFEVEASNHWEMRTSRAAQEADALVRLAEKSKPKFSAGILAALGQEAFRQITQNQVDPDCMARMVTLFMKARGDERTDRMQELKREKVSRELEDQIEQALEQLAEEVERHPAAREAFEALQRELENHAEET